MFKVSNQQNPACAETAVQKAIRIAGGPTALARELRQRGHLRVNSHATVNAWVIAGKVPARYCPDIEDLTQVPCEALDPETKWGLVRGSSEHAHAPFSASQVAQ